MSIGKKIQRFRKERKLTQEELAKKIGISKSLMSKIEIDNKNPSLEVLIKLANILDIPLENLADNVDIEDLIELKKTLVNKTYRTNKEKVVANAILRDIDEAKEGFGLGSVDIIMHNLSFLLNNEVDSIEVLKYYISSKKYDINKLTDESLNEIDRKFSDILELEFYKLKSNK